MAEYVSRAVERALSKYDQGKNNFSLWGLMTEQVIGYQDNGRELKEEVRTHVIEALGFRGAQAVTYVVQPFNRPVSRERVFVLSRDGEHTRSGFSLPDGV